MNKTPFPMKYFKSVVIGLSLFFVGVSCLPVFPTPASSTPIIQTVIVTREVTHEVTQEVTRIVEIPVTDTATPTPVDTDTPTSTPTSAVSPTNTPIPEPPAVTVLIHTQCLFGPDPVYLRKYELLAASHQVVIGRNQDSNWLLVKGTDHKDPCWVMAQQLKVDSGNLTSTLLTEPALAPYSTIYGPPPAVSTTRAGNDVTIFWQPVTMTEEDYHGYLIEAWVCKNGKLIFIPKSYTPTFDKNNTIMAIKVTDEPGCVEPSSARIYSVNNQGYSKFKTVAWPTPAPTLTPTPK
jgi:hypothetical protein